MHGVAITACGFALAYAFPTHAQSAAAPARVQPLSRLVACQSIEATADRLACFDREVAALDKAERDREVLIVDRAEVRATRRSLFGFRLPQLKLFGTDEDREEEDRGFTAIETTIAQATRSGGALSFTLEDGARWVQTDSIQLASQPRAGTTIRIRQGALGSFLANIGDAPAIRVRRVN